MFQSKAIKDFSDEKRSKLYSWWVETTISEYYYSFVHKFIENPIFQVKRLYQWYVNVFRYDYDFDGHCLFAIIEYKLKRLEKVLINGHAVQEPKDMKALRLAIKLAARLKEDRYEVVAHERIEKKWGELKTWTEPYDKVKGSSLWHSRYAKVNNKEDEAKCWEDRKTFYLAAEKKMKREEKNLYAILHRYLRYWWD